MNAFIWVGNDKVRVPLRSYPLLSRYRWYRINGQIVTDLQDCYGAWVDIRWLTMFPYMSAGSHGVN
jgi:hypothetical protein